MLTKEVQDSWVWNVTFSHLPAVQTHVLLLILCQSFSDIQKGRSRPWNWHVPKEFAKKYDLNANFERQSWRWPLPEGLRAHFRSGIVLITLYPLQLLPLPFSASSMAQEACLWRRHCLGSPTSHLAIVFSQCGALADQRVGRERLRYVFLLWNLVSGWSCGPSFSVSDAIAYDFLSLSCWA